MAMTLIRSAASAPNTVAAIPGVPRMRSPIAATTATGWAAISSMWPRVRSSLERRAKRPHHARRLRRANHEADVVLGRGLGNHQDVRLLLGHDIERLRDDAGNPLHARSADPDQADAANRGDRLHAGHRRIAFHAHARAGVRRVETVQDPHRNALAERGQDRLVVQHLRAVVGELGRLAVGNLRQRLRARHLRRIRSHHAIDIGPDPDFVRIERGAEDGRGIVGPSAAERRLDAIHGRADEPGHDRGRAASQHRRQPLARARTRLVHQRLRRAELVRRHEQLGGVDGRGLAPARANRRGDERSGEHLADTRDRIEQPRRQLVDHRQAEAQLLEPIEPAVDVGNDRIASGRIRHDRFGGGSVHREQTLSNLGIPVSGGSRACRVDERVGHAAHRGGDNGDAVTVIERRRNEGGGLSNALGGPDRGPAELHDNEHRARSIIDLAKRRGGVR